MAYRTHNLFRSLVVGNVIGWLLTALVVVL